MTVTAADVRTVDQVLSFILGGGQPKYLLFWGHQPPSGGGTGKGCLSQWWPVPVTVDGVTYPSAERYTMAAKALLFGDDETAARIGLAADDERAASPQQWPGLNLLGFALMEVRHQLRSA